jgi:hypothetical protein
MILVLRPWMEMSERLPKTVVPKAKMGDRRWKMEKSRTANLEL